MGVGTKDLFGCSDLEYTNHQNGQALDACVHMLFLTVEQHCFSCACLFVWKMFEILVGGVSVTSRSRALVTDSLPPPPPLYFLHSVVNAVRFVYRETSQKMMSAQSKAKSHHQGNTLR